MSWTKSPKRNDFFSTFAPNNNAILSANSIRNKLPFIYKYAIMSAGSLSLSFFFWRFILSSGFAFLSFFSCFLFVVPLPPEREVKLNVGEGEWPPPLTILLFYYLFVIKWFKFFCWSISTLNFAYHLEPTFLECRSHFHWKLSQFRFQFVSLCRFANGVSTLDR